MLSCTAAAPPPEEHAWREGVGDSGRRQVRGEVALWQLDAVDRHTGLKRELRRDLDSAARIADGRDVTVEELTTLHREGTGHSPLGPHRIRREVVLELVPADRNGHVVRNLEGVKEELVAPLYVRANPHYSRVTELLVVQAFSSVMTQMDAGVMTIEAMRRPVG